MSPHVLWWDVALRLACSFAAAAVIGLDREEQGRVAGLRTMILVGLAAAGAMITADLLLAGSGRAANFLRADVLRLPQGILAGMGFLGAGAIVRRSDLVWGVTTAATLWMVTVIGLIFGAGLFWLGGAISIVSAAVVWGLRYGETHMTRKHHALLKLTFDDGAQSAERVETLLGERGIAIAARNEAIGPDGHELRLRVKWYSRDAADQPRDLVRLLARFEGIRAVDWQARDSS